MADFLSLSPDELELRKLHQHLLGAINPRPIAFVSTVSDDGEPNLSPFSFFNVFGANPPVLIFSPARRGRNNTTKDTYHNLRANGECTVNIVSYDMVEQMNLSSSEYPSDVDEFSKAGFSAVKSDKVKAARVGESPASFECVMRDIVNYGEVAGGGNMIICEVVKLHLRRDILGEDGFIDPYLIDTVGRLGRSWYTRTREGLFEVKAPKGNDNIGFDRMPAAIRNSNVLTGNELGKLGTQPDFPSSEEVTQFLSEHKQLKALMNESEHEHRLHMIAKSFLEKGDISSAWKVLMANKI